MNFIILMTAFSILFLGELGDKTQLIVFNLSLEQEKSYKVGLGATLGFAIIVTISVFFGAIITRFIPIFLISIFSGSIFILIGILETRGLKGLYFERKIAENKKNTENSKENEGIIVSGEKSNRIMGGWESRGVGGEQRREREKI